MAIEQKYVPRGIEREDDTMKNMSNKVDQKTALALSHEDIKILKEYVMNTHTNNRTKQDHENIFKYLIDEINVSP